MSQAPDPVWRAPAQAEPPLLRNTLLSPPGAGPSRGKKHPRKIRRSLGGRGMQTAETILVNSVQRRGFKNKNSLVHPALTHGRNFWLLMHLQPYQTSTSPHFSCWKAPAEFMSFLHLSALGSPGCTAECLRCVQAVPSCAAGWSCGPAIPVQYC